MILFYQDWFQKYPSAIADYSTPNRSFVKMAMLYKKMGVKNYEFMLCLINPTLQGVDPHSPDLTQDQMDMIAIECKLNFWYYIREVARIPGQAGDSVPVEGNRGNLALWWLFFNHATTYLIQIRQTGKSVSSDSLTAYLANVRCRNTLINIITKDEELKSENLSRIKNIINELPPYMIQRTKKDLGNSEIITVSRLGNRIRGHLPKPNPKQARNVGRGLTSPINLFDELAFLVNMWISLPVALSSGTAARGIAARNGEPYGTIFTTTAGKKDDKDGKFAYGLLEESASWTESFFDADDEHHLLEIITAASPGKVYQVACVFGHRQLGKSDEWLLKTLKETKSKGEDADRDYFNVWTAGSLAHPLETHLLEKIRNAQRNIEYSELAPRPYNYVTKWYIPENDVDRYMNQDFHVMSLDTSDAVGRDAIFMTLRNVRTGNTTSTFMVNDTNILRFTEWLATWFTRFPRFVLIPERKSTGTTIIDILIETLKARGIDPFKRIFNRIVDAAEQFPNEFKEISKPFGVRSSFVYSDSIYRKSFGFATAGSGYASRSELYSTTLTEAATNTASGIYDKTVIDQLLGLVINNNRVDHAPGEHDDAVISWLLGYWFLSKGRNLSFYGIDHASVLRDCQTKLEERQSVDHYQAVQQHGIRQEMLTLMEELKQESDDTVIFRLENKLRRLASNVTLQASETFSVDSYLDTLRTERKQRRFSRHAQVRSPTLDYRRLH